MGAEGHAPCVSGNKPEAVSVSAWFVGGTQKWFPLACAASLKTLRFLLVFLSPDTDVGALGDTQPDLWPPRLRGSRAMREAGSRPPNCPHPASGSRSPAAAVLLSSELG